MALNLLQGLGQAQPVSQFIDTALRFQQAGNQNALSQMQMEKERLQLDELKKQQAHLDEEVDFRATPLYLSLPNSAKPEAERMFKNLGAFGDNYRGTRRAMYLATGEIEKSAELYKALGAPVLEAKRLKVADAFSKWMQNPQDPKAKAFYESERMQYEAQAGTFDSHLKSLDRLTTASPGSDVLDAMGNVVHSVPQRPTAAQSGPETAKVHNFGAYHVPGYFDEGGTFHETGKRVAAAPTPGQQDLALDRAIRGYQSAIGVKARIEQMAAGGTVPGDIAASGDPQLTSILGMFAGKQIDRTTANKLISQVDKVVAIRKSQLKKLGYDIGDVAPPPQGPARAPAPNTWDGLKDAITNAGATTSSGAVGVLVNTYGYDEATARGIVKHLLESGRIK
jgi:hypothetical protein